MEILKIEINLLKAAFAEKNISDWVFGYDEGEMVYLSDRYSIWFIPDKKFLLDMDILKDIGVKERGIETMKKIADDSGVLDLEKTNELVNIPGKKKTTCSVLRSVDGENQFDVLVNESMLKMFSPDSHFRGSSPTSPVFVYEDEKKVGLVLPVKPLK